MRSVIDFIVGFSLLSLTILCLLVVFVIYSIFAWIAGSWWPSDVLRAFERADGKPDE